MKLFQEIRLCNLGKGDQKYLWSFAMCCLEKDGDLLDQPCEKQRSITNS